MSSRSDGHECEVCGVYAPHGFKQTDGDYYWYCFAHRPEDYKLSDPLKSQEAFAFEAPSVESHVEMERAKNSFNWSYGFKIWIHWEMKPGQEMIGEEMVKHAAKWIGAPSKGNVIGPACKTMADHGYLIDTGRWQSMQNEGSNSRRSPVWRRTDKR